MTTVTTSFPITISQTLNGSSAFNVNESLINAKRAVSFATQTAWTVTNQFRSFTISSAKSLQLYASVNLSSTSFEIKDIRGNPVTSVRQSPLTSTLIFTMNPNDTYIVTVFSTVTVLINTILLNLSGFVTPTVASFFEAGFENQIPSSLTSVTNAIDSFGQVTYTFTNFPCIANTPLNLTIAKFALQSGTVLVTSSNSNVFTSFADPFNVYSSLYIIVRPNITTNFTGTITISINGVGLSSQVDLDSIGIANSFKNLLAASLPQPPQILPANERKTCKRVRFESEEDEDLDTSIDN